MTINWHNIRSINGDQKEGFEEFVTQIARKENVPNKKKFIRKGKPDAGAECFWILEDDSEWVWQAKFFTSSFQKTQWQQIDKSVNTVLNKHNKISKYFIAFPIDPPDGRIENQTSLLEKWNQHVEKWEKIAEKKAINVKFIALWSSDLIDKMQQIKNEGFIQFWFEAEIFSNDYFKKHTKSAIKNLGKRYTPDINVKTDMLDIFEALSRSKVYLNKLYDLMDTVIIKCKKIYVHTSLKDSSNELYTTITNEIEKLDVFYFLLEEEYKNILFSVKNNHHYNFDKLISNTTSLLDIIYNIQNSIPYFEKDADSTHMQEFRYLQHNIRAVLPEIHSFKDFIENEKTLLFNFPCLVIQGKAGVGKSHLIADVVNSRTDNNQSSLFLLGQHFIADENPKSQITKMIDYGGTFSELLEILNSKAQTNNSRTIIFIDAINEGNGLKIWPLYLNEILTEILSYEWLGVVLTVRSSYWNIFKDNFESISNFSKFSHYGFKGHEYNAIKLFFQNYNIVLPNIPLLHPEFQNPLFLKLFCEGLKNAKLTKIPPGFIGITKIFDFFVNSINAKLSKPGIFDYNCDLKIVDNIISEMIKYEIENECNYVPLNDSAKIVQKIQKDFGIRGDFFSALLSEGLFAKNIFWKSDNSYFEALYISYERFQDHLVISEILKNATEKNINSYFENNGALNKYFKDQNSLYYNNGLIEALSIQIPERFSHELFEYIEEYKNEDVVISAFIDSLLWRKTEASAYDVALDYINKIIIPHNRLSFDFWNVIISVSSNENHFFNAKITHKFLLNQSMADRDSFWIPLTRFWEHENNSIKRLIDWAWSLECKNHISDNSIELTSIMLVWFLNTSIRRLRDFVTKALICLLNERINVLIKVIDLFIEVNDPYILERLFAVAYGCAVRTKDVNILEQLSLCIYKHIFDKEHVYPNILLRDYARQAIEYYLHKKNNPKILLSKIRPPYKSVFPEIPNDEEVKKYNIPFDSEKKELYGQSVRDIFNSMRVERNRDGRPMGYGDFGRYIFQSAFHYWPQLNTIDLMNIALKKIFIMGYSVKKHGAFDSNLPHISRRASSSERIGKKYQWIALYELLAQVSDNFQMMSPYKHSFCPPQELTFSGPWNPYVRNFDPTTLYLKKEKKVFDIKSELDYDEVNFYKNNWISSVADLPDPLNLINSNDWFLLNGFYKKTENKPFGQDTYDNPRKEIWYSIRSYLVKKEEFDKIYHWLQGKRFIGLWMPHTSDLYQLYNREFYWSPAYDFFQDPYYDGNCKAELINQNNNEKIGNLIITEENYLWESEYDFSFEKQIIKYKKPSNYFIEKLKLNYNYQDSYMYNKKNELVCFDYSENEETEPKLFFNKQILLDLIKKEQMKIIWTICSQKNIIGGKHDYNRSWPEVSGVYTLDDNNNIIGKIYETTEG